ncbi:DUF4179 domain-containing protein [Lysinibacillus piscis]|uniref:DUF4179 domain-containing protein n=1 Tax=Lysinibacillus piscis TaxID=2518931 RepID=A0ABQ5NMH7_9BACI|nr:DUF4179 domain-containing protein [Lysinibacillus sp. KH24]GLC89550.1 hypothetical protein LYSBPC_26770 [Lysinibacillus sp. KH24]
MQNDLFKDIDTPHVEVRQAIQQGVTRGQRTKKIRKYKRFSKQLSLIGLVAASLLFISSLLFQPIYTVVADVPLIGDLYKKLHISIGENIASENLLTEINTEVIDNDVSMTITSAFYDGYFLGITFKATGKHLFYEQEQASGPETGYTFEMFNRKDETTWWSSTLTSLEKEGDGYVGAIIFRTGDEQPNISTLPITFTHIASVNGEWAFNVPIKTLPSKNMPLQQIAVSQDKAYAVQFTEATINATSLIVHYKILQQAGVENEYFQFKGKIKTKGGSAFLRSTDTNRVILEKNTATEKIILEPYFKINKKEIPLTPIEINVK